MLLDTSGLLCYYHRDEPGHADAVELFENATTRVIHDYVLAEFLPLCHVRGLNRVGVLEFMADLLENPEIELIWVEEGLHLAASALLRARLDKSYSFCDAVSFVTMRQYGITKALTTDHHFEQEGFVRLLTP